MYGFDFRQDVSFSGNAGREVDRKQTLTLSALGDMSQPVATMPKTGARGTRTPDLLHAMQTRSQLRHGPVNDDYGRPSPGTQHHD